MPFESRNPEAAHTSSPGVAFNHGSLGISRPAVPPLQGMLTEEQHKNDHPPLVDGGHARVGDADAKPFQLRPNNTGIPDNLKSGIESLSGYSMDDVKVHYNSPKPVQLQALAYAQGTDIHIAPGQERHLPHEAWHVIQQKQGRVSPTLQMKAGVSINDDKGLEKEADVMGEQALLMRQDALPGTQDGGLSTAGGPVQAVAQLRNIGLFGMEAEVEGNSFEIITDEIFEDNDILKDPEIILEEYSVGNVFGEIEITLDNEVSGVGADGLYRRKYAVEFIQKPIDILAKDADKDILIKQGAWEMVMDFWAAVFANRELSLARVMEQRDEWLGSINEKWEGSQFSKYKNNQEMVTTKEDEEHNETYHFDWKKTLHGINATSPDPMVSPQLTVGSTLIAAESAFLATLDPLKKNTSFTEDRARELGMKAPENDKQLAGMEVNALLGIIRRYLIATRPMPPEPKRYMKEYTPMMVRNSLDSVFSAMSALGQKLFFSRCLAYLKGEPDNMMLNMLQVRPEDPIFLRTASEEDDAELITVKDLLFSILKIKSGAEGTLVKDDEAPEKDAFAQAGLSGMGEINNTNPEAIQRFGLTAPDEMMAGIKGIIVEHRWSESRPLSGMAQLFMETAKALQIVNKMMENGEKKEK